jgi:hypothetical protein
MQKYGNAEGAAHVAALLAAAAAEAAAAMVADGGRQQQLPVPCQLDFGLSNSPEVSMHSNFRMRGGGSTCLPDCCAEMTCLVFCRLLLHPRSGTLLDHHALTMYARHAAVANDIKCIVWCSVSKSALNLSHCHCFAMHHLLCMSR